MAPSSRDCNSLDTTFGIKYEKYSKTYENRFSKPFENKTN